jgi:hypothetical protein
MLRLTKKADYGLMALKYLAEQTDGSAHSAKDIAEAYHIPPQLLAKILQTLAKAGLHYDSWSLRPDEHLHHQRTVAQGERQHQGLTEWHPHRRFDRGGWGADQNGRSGGWRPGQHCSVAIANWR